MMGDALNFSNISLDFSEYFCIDNTVVNAYLLYYINFKCCYTRLLGGTDFLCIYISKFDKIKFSILPFFLQAAKNACFIYLYRKRRILAIEF